MTSDAPPPPPQPAPPRAGPPAPLPVPGAPDAPVPPSARNERRRLLSARLALVMVGIALLAGAVGAVVVAGPALVGRSNTTACEIHLATLGMRLAAERALHPDAPLPPGPALFVAWRATGRLGVDEAELLLCADDPDSLEPGSSAWLEAWSDVDLANPPRGICSYAVRDFAAFPLVPNAKSPQPIAACLHHGATSLGRGVAVVLFDDANVRRLGFEELGISSNDELVAGPRSKVPLLRVMIGGGSTGR